MNRLPAGIELRSARPDDREAIVALLHERMSSEISIERWRRLFTIPGSGTSRTAAWWFSSGAGSPAISE